MCDEALRLGRILAGLVPREPEVHGLLALMELQASRSKARVAPNGEPVLLPDQDRARWDRLLIRRGLAALERAEALGDRKKPCRERVCQDVWISVVGVFLKKTTKRAERLRP